jgi:hypothetical protein
MRIRYGMSQVGFAANFIEYGNGSPPPSTLVSVPKVVGDTQTAASTALVQAGLTTGQVTTQSSTTVASGLVISEDPAADTSVTSGSAVSLVVSSGTPDPTPPASVDVPNVVGDTQAQASAALVQAGLTTGQVTTQSSTTVASGLVISENPAAGASVSSGNAVSLVISSGPAPPPAANEADLTGVFSNLSTSYGGRILTGNFIVENIGNAATATWFRVLLYLSNDGISKTSLLGTARVKNSIKPGDSVSLSIYKSFMVSVSGKYLIAVMDPDSRVPDSNRANNVVKSQVLQAKKRK